MHNPLGHLSAKQFLSEYWQQKPLVVRGAFADFDMPFSAEELAGLVCETDAPARIISENGFAPDHKAWDVKHTPLDDDDFINTPETHWTFLVNDVERYVPELGNLIEPFRFIPDWRIDDLMVSFATDKGSVGPHVDQYDVFLIQGEGKRLWQIDRDPDYDQSCIKGPSLAILEHFNATDEWLLEKGDMLYLPPNIPHHGIADGDCFTFSVGFRAPSNIDLLQNWVDSFSHNPEQLAKFTKRFTDTKRELQGHSGEIAAKDIKNLSTLMLELIESQRENIPVFLGKHLTESKGERPVDQTSDTSILSGSVLEKLSADQEFERESWLRLAYISDENTKNIHLFADGKHIVLQDSLKKQIETFCENYYYEAKTLEPLLENEEFRQLFQQLIAEGGIYPA